MLCEKIPVEEVMKAMNVVKFGRMMVKNIPINVTATLRTFKNKGIKCDVCGVEGSHFEVKVDKSSYALSLELVAKRGEHRVIMTKDHTDAKCIGGASSPGNYIPMCSYCNGVWKSRIDEKLKKSIAGKSLDGQYYLIIQKEQ